MRMHLHIWKKIARFARVCRICGEAQKQELISKWHLWETVTFDSADDYNRWVTEEKALEVIWNKRDKQKEQEYQDYQKELEKSRKIVRDETK